MSYLDRRKSGYQTLFDNLHEFCNFLGATRIIERLLIANNGLAAVKGIESIRGWLFEHIGDTQAVEFVVMATPEDLKANAEFISIADRHVAVPGGPNSNNYANVSLILQIAMQNSCDAIYPGWGHASENPALPHGCSMSKNKVIFLGPSEKAMFALGDKIASTIVAQSNGVPTVPWSGDEIRLPPGIFDVDPLLYEKTYITSVEECEKVCRRIGFPVMIKASEGGGGKGIRRCLRIEEVRDMFVAVMEEVKGCHIFVMRMLENVRHLEVQLLADDYGDCIAVHTRDCSVQRRHQKIIEEGPVFGVDPSIITSMEAAAIRLAKAVGYRGLGTVEYMYDKTTQKFFFLELNPRIQVEHPVSELISGVNLPAALLCVGMGVPLHRIPEVRSFYGEKLYETTPIDFSQRKSVPAKGHTIAVRVTAENTEEGFRPTSGRVEEITFKNSKECWGYFSIPPGGEVHQFADSQFGHIFSSGVTREDARRGMVMALRNLVIRGEIHTSTSYVLELLEREEFCASDISTAWLDHLIAERAVQGPQDQDVHLALMAACVFRMLRKSEENAGKYVAFLSAGHVPSTEYLNNNLTESYVNRNKKYTLSMGMTSPTEVAIALNGSTVVVPFRRLKSGALQLTVAGKSFIAYAEKEPRSLRISIGGKETTFTGDEDPTKIFSSVPGRFVRYVVDDGGRVVEGSTIAEVEVMKMILPLRSTIAGVLHHRVAPSTTIAVGTLIGDITLDDPSKVTRPQEARELWPSALMNDCNKKMERPDGLTRVQRGVEALFNMLQGYNFSGIALEKRLKTAFENLSSLGLSSVALTEANFPVLAKSISFTDPDKITGGSTRNEKLKAVVHALIVDYITAEQPFANCSRQEAITRLRETRDDPMEVYALDFAHNQPCHHGVIKALLSMLENNLLLLKSLQDTLSSILELSSSTYGSLALQVRYLLRQCSLPSFSERKAAFAKELEEGRITDLIQGSYGNDLMCAVMFDRQTPHLIQLCLELYVRREYFGESHVKNLDIFLQHGCWYGFYEYEPLEDHDPLQAGDFSVMEGNSTEDTPQSGGAGFCMMFPDDQVLRSTWKAALNEFLLQGHRSFSVCTVFFATSRHTTDEEAARQCQQLLEEHVDVLLQHGNLKRVTFIVHGISGGPYTFTYRQSLAWHEDTLIRNIAPLSARRLELHRLTNYDVTMYPTPFKEVHLFHATPKKKNASYLESRIFARVLVSPRDLGVEAWSEGNEIDAGHMLTKCLGALEFARNDNTFKYPIYNHVFIKMVELTFEVTGLKKLFEHVGNSYRQRLIHLGVTEVELSFNVRVSSGYIPFRVIVSSPAGYTVSMHICYEWIENGKVCLRRAENSEDIAISFASMSCDNVNEMALGSTNGENNIIPPPPNNDTGNNNNNNNSRSIFMRTVSRLSALRNLLPSRETMESGTIDMSSDAEVCVPLELYPLLGEKQMKRLQARVLHTVYVHDWPLLIGTVLRSQWDAHARGRNFLQERIPTEVVKAKELFLDSADGTTLCEEKRPGHVPCGMIVWLVTLFPPTYYESDTNNHGSRHFVMVANDITFQSGSFAVPEDKVFCAASELARQMRVPFVYLSANSGARLGLSMEVKKRFRVAFNDANEMEYLYLLPEDYEELKRLGVQLAVEAMQKEDEQGEGDNEMRYIIRGIVGGPNEYLGVENLRGSGLIAGQMSRSYSEVPTISIVSGRSVGIGAYLNRIGRRVIQTNDSPLILTGAGALNRILGKEVYSDNSQLGGKQVMVPNGVTHWCTKSNYASVEALLRWLNYIPPTVDPLRCCPRVLQLPCVDPIDRDVTFTPQAGEAYDPRCLICGSGDKTGLFDRGSWTETLEGWAKSVVAGRATLGGIPCGIILVETRLTRKYNPADPADPTSTSSFIPQAGQVWFPDSARKTADALDDFHRERLPCFIFANWRGFSGGMRDMFDEVLKFGASIVDNVRVYNCPLFIYIPPHGELRGGAWVVVDPVINHNGAVEMYCDYTSRGGIMEPSGVVEIKFREKDVRELIRRNNPQFATLNPEKLREEENRLLPLYRDVAVRFADLHDTHVRMQATGVVRGVIPWKESRRLFHAKLQRKLKEMSMAASMVETKKVGSLAEGVRNIEEAFMQDHPDTPWGTNDALHMQWLAEKEESKSFLSSEFSVLPPSPPPISTPTSPSHSMENMMKRLLTECKADDAALENCFEGLFADEKMLKAATKAMQRVQVAEKLEEFRFSEDE